MKLKHLLPVFAIAAFAACSDADPIPGCTDPEASNYNANATEDDGNCIYRGCTDEEADNYLATANEDDGTCTYFTKYEGSYSGEFTCEGVFAGLLNSADMEITMNADGNGTDEVFVVVSGNDSDLVFNLNAVITKDSIFMNDTIEDVDIEITFLPDAGPYTVVVDGELSFENPPMIEGPVHFTISTASVPFPVSDDCYYIATKN
mgnify:CR=1 FL=1